MTTDKLLEEIALEEELLNQEFEETIDENLKAFERSILDNEAIEESSEKEVNLELLMEELANNDNTIVTSSLCGEKNSSSLEDIILILKKYPELKITLSL